MINRDEWMAALHEAGAMPVEHSDAITTREFAAMLEIGISAAKDRLRMLVDAGKATRVSRRSKDVTGRHQFVPAYLLKPVEKTKAKR